MGWTSIRLLIYYEEKMENKYSKSKLPFRCPAVKIISCPSIGAICRNLHM